MFCDANPDGLDYRALSNAGLWCIGRLQTDSDRARAFDGLSGATTNLEPLECVCSISSHHFEKQKSQCPLVHDGSVTQVYPLRHFFVASHGAEHCWAPEVSDRQ